jgi:hypothetical protein
VVTHTATKTSPKIPRAAPDYPDPEQEVRDGVRGDGVTQPVFPQYQPLISQTADNAGQPLRVLKPK